MKRKLLGAVVLALATLVFNPVWAQEAPAVDRTSTGGAQTLEDILARQKQLEIDESFRSENLGNPANAAPISGRLVGIGDASTRRFEKEI